MVNPVGPTPSDPVVFSGQDLSLRTEEGFVPSQDQLDKAAQILTQSNSERTGEAAANGVSLTSPNISITQYFSVVSESLSEMVKRFQSDQMLDAQVNGKFFKALGAEVLNLQESRQNALSEVLAQWKVTHANNIYIKQHNSEVRQLLYHVQLISAFNPNLDPSKLTEPWKVVLQADIDKIKATREAMNGAPFDPIDPNVPEARKIMKTPITDSPLATDLTIESLLNGAFKPSAVTLEGSTSPYPIGLPNLNSLVPVQDESIEGLLTNLNNRLEKASSIFANISSAISDKSATQAESTQELIDEVKELLTKAQESQGGSISSTGSGSVALLLANTGSSPGEAGLLIDTAILEDTIKRLTNTPISERLDDSLRNIFLEVAKQIGLQATPNAIGLLAAASNGVHAPEAKFDQLAQLVSALKASKEVISKELLMNLLDAIKEKLEEETVETPEGVVEAAFTQEEIAAIIERAQAEIELTLLKASIGALSTSINSSSDLLDEIFSQEITEFLALSEAERNKIASEGTEPLPTVNVQSIIDKIVDKLDTDLKDPTTQSIINELLTSLFGIQKLDFDKFEASDLQGLKIDNLNNVPVTRFIRNKEIREESREETFFDLFDDYLEVIARHAETPKEKEEAIEKVVESNKKFFERVTSVDKALRDWLDPGQEIELFGIYFNRKGREQASVNDLIG